jgi:hypothetical protein
VAGSLAATAAATTTAAPAAAWTGTTSTTSTTTAAVNCSASAGGPVLSRTGWVASSNAPAASWDGPANALDGNPGTRFSTNEDQALNLYLAVDMGSPQSFDELEMDAANAPQDYARGYDVEVSANGSSWTVVASCTGSGTPEIVSFPTQTAQWVAVVLSQGSSSWWWSVDELYLFGPAGNQPGKEPANQNGNQNGNRGHHFDKAGNGHHGHRGYHHHHRHGLGSLT